MNKWVCNRCRREVTEQPKKNGICNNDGCKGRFSFFAQCKSCGNWFKSSKGTTFCVKCRTDGKKKMKSETVECCNCGKTFKRYRSNIKSKQQFCSAECFRQYRHPEMVQRVCKECGKSFLMYKSSLEQSNASGNYCSRACYDKSMRIEGSVSYKGGFERVKRQNFNTVQFCALCGTTKKIHIHHIIPFRLTQDNGLDNLVPLCSSHHKKFENATLPFIETMDDMDEAKVLLNNIIRAKQYETAKVIAKILCSRRQRNVSQNA